MKEFLDPAEFAFSEEEKRAFNELWPKIRPKTAEERQAFIQKHKGRSLTEIIRAELEESGYYNSDEDYVTFGDYVLNVDEVFFYRWMI